MESFVIVAIVWVLILIGLVGTILPGLPGVAFVFGGILLYGLYFGVSTIGVQTLVYMGLVTLCSFSFDFIASLCGAKRFGATRYGIIGSALGGLVGIVFLNIPGLFLGTFVGALAGEYFLARKSWQDGLRAGVGSVLGFLAGSIIKFVLAFVMIIIFILRIWV